MASDPLGAASLPHRFGRYMLLEVLGEGGFAKVYRAEMEGPAGFRKRVALKLIKGRTLAQERELHHEGRLGGLLKHRNVVDTYELGRVEETVYLAMELIEGLSLRQLMNHGSLPPAIVLEVLHSIARGLAYAHTLGGQAGIVHLDLKPENVLIGWDGAVKVTDFGIARLFGTESEDQRVISGTPRYMSPEQWTRKPLTAASDVFSFGLMAAELLVEYPLIDVSTVQQGQVFTPQFEAQVQAVIAELNQQIAGFGTCMERCLHLEPQSRYASAQELLKPLRQLWQQVGHDPLLEDWLADVLVPNQHAALPLTSGSASIYAGGVSDTIHLEGDDDPLESLEHALRESSDQASALAALAALEQAVCALPLEQRGQWLKSAPTLLGAAGFEVMREGPLPFVVADANHKQFWLAGESIVQFRGKALGGRLLNAIATHGDTWDRERLWVEVWEQPYRPPSSDTALRVQVHRLREKLKASGLVIEGQADGRYILNGQPAVLCWRGQRLEVSATPMSTPAQPVGQATSNLPPELDGFWGRVEERDRLLAEWEQGRRYVSIHGPPGVGKSRFAKHAAHRALATGLFERVWVCDFTEVNDEEGVLAKFSETLGIDPTETHEREQTLRRLQDVFTAHGKSLWVLEQPESIASLLGPLLEDWWTSQPGLSVLMVSQRALDVAQSSRFRLDPMALPPATVTVDEVAGWPILQLFEERAKGVKPDFVLTSENLGAVCGIVSAVDGLALGVELAAARMGMMSVSQIHRLLSERLQMVTQGDAASGLRRSLEWAWGLLSEVEQSVLAQCSVFEGGCSWEAAEAILEAPEWVVDVLGRLVNQSLVVVHEQGEESRLDLLSVVRAFAAERLQEMGSLADVVKERHVRWFAAQGQVAETRARRIIGADGRTLYAERKNLNVAVNQALSLGLVEEAQAACLAQLDVVRQVGPLNGGIRIAQRVLTACPTPSDTRDRLCLALAELQLRVGRLDQAETHFQTLSQGASPVAIRALCQWSRKRMAEGEVEQAQGLLETAMELAAVVGENHLSSLVHMRLGDCLLKQGRVDDALTYLHQATVLAESIGDRELLIDAHRFLGVAHWTLGDSVQAATCYHAALEWSRALGRRRSAASLGVDLAIIEDNGGDSEQACRGFEHALEVYQSLGDRLEIQFVLVNWGVALERLGRLDEARKLYERALVLARGTQNIRIHGVLLGNLAVLHARSQEFEQAEQLFTEALALHRDVGNQREACVALTNLGYVNRDLKRPEAAKQFFEEALVVAESVKDAKQVAVLRGLLGA